MPIKSTRKLAFLSALVVAALGLMSVLATVQPAAHAAPSALVWPSVNLITLTTGITLPTGMANAGDGTNRLFVLTQAGRILLYKNGALQPTPFLDIISKVRSPGNGGGGNEEGLLGLAFPPNYTTTHHFYVYYTTRVTGTLANGDIVLARYNLTGNPDVADATSEQKILTISHALNTNHNGGQLNFGPDDGFLYVSTGDGGGSGDAPNNAQTGNILLGKLLRLNVETGNPLTYTIPSSNPYTQTAGFRPEVWALGLRNPWKYSFDKTTHDLYIADVGQNLYEEIDKQSAGSGGGQNYGWHILEGNTCFNPSSGCVAPASYAAPILVYSHTAGRCAVIGGYVYRGTQYAAWQGTYFYGDACKGNVWALQYDGSAWQTLQVYTGTTGSTFSSFGEDESGNLYVTDNTRNVVYRLTSSTPTAVVVTQVGALSEVDGRDPLLISLLIVGLAAGGGLAARLWRTRARMDSR